MVETELTVCLEVFRTDQSLPSIAISESNVNCFELDAILQWNKARHES